MEMLQLVLFFIAAALLLIKPEREKLAYRLTCLAMLSTFLVLFIAFKAMLLPGINY